MEISIKKQTAFILDGNLLEDLKNAAKREHRSLNNFVEFLLRGALYDEPNAETKAAIEEARKGKDLKKVDTSCLDNFIRSCSE